MTVIKIKSTEQVSSTLYLKIVQLLQILFETLHASDELWARKEINGKKSFNFLKI